MISLPKLDDQNYAEIVEAAKRRIPVIFPEWTDFNEHDPGITVIELFAWLKEMQQYTLDRIPDSTREAMLRLAGVQPLEAAPASVELIPAAPPEFLPAGSTAHSADGTEFTLGKGVVLRESDKDEATIITSGIMVDEALKAYEQLQAEGIAVRVVDMFTWKPLDEELVVKCAAETGAIVTAENHNVTCGLGSVVANCLAKNRPTVQEFVGVDDQFGQVGPQAFLMDEYGLRAANIVAAVKKAIARK